MTPDELFQQLVAAQANLPEQASINHIRLNMEALGTSLPIADGIAISESTLSGAPGLRMLPERQASPWHLMYFHGGGYVSGSAVTHRGLTSQLAAACDATTWSIDYRLAPESPFPAAIDDATRAYTALLTSGIDPKNILIAGDSAGGGLSLAAVLKARELNLPMPAGIILLSPWLDLSSSGCSYEADAVVDPVIDLQSLRMTKEAYLGNADERSPLASPIFADLSGFPPMLVQVGTREHLLSDSLNLAEKVALANGDITMDVYADMVHVFHAFYPFLRASRQAIQRIGEWTSNLEARI